MTPSSCFKVVFFVSLALQASAIGEGVLDVDALMGVLTGFANMFTNIPTVDIDSSKVMGRWYQMYKAAINFDVFRTQMFCPVAYFSENSVMGDGGFSMQEGYRVISKNGPIETYKRDITKISPGVYMMYTEEYFYPRQLVIIKTEPPVEQANDTYDYLIATDSNRLALMVFARDPVQFYNEYNDDVLAFLKEKGFGGQVFWNEPKAIYQGSDCQWPSEKEVFARRVLKNHGKTKTQFQKRGPISSLNPVQAIQGIVSSLNGKR